VASQFVFASEQTKHRPAKLDRIHQVPLRALNVLDNVRFASGLNPIPRGRNQKRVLARFAVHRLRNAVTLARRRGVDGVYTVKVHSANCGARQQRVEQFQCITAKERIRVAGLGLDIDANHTEARKLITASRATSAAKEV
jgi:hypothetical protein